MNAMSPRHILGTAVFDVAFASEEEAFAQHQDLAAHARERLLAVIDEVFDEVGGGGPVYRFDEIEIDLGELPPGDYREEMEQRLRLRLRALLLARLPVLQAEPVAGVSVVSRERAELERLEQFLSSGRLPWSARRDEAITLEQRAGQVLRDSGTDFIAYLKKKDPAEREIVIRRLIAQFPDALLAEIASRLEPSHSGLIEALTAALARAGAALARETRQIVWSTLLGILIDSAGRPLSPEAMVEAILARMARRSGSVAPSAAQAAGDPVASAPERFAAGLATLFAARASAPTTWHAGRMAPAQPGGGGRSDDAALAAALFHGGDAEIESAWRETLRRHPDLLRVALRRRGASAAARARLAEALPEWLLDEAVRHLEPEGMDLVSAALGQADLFREILDLPSADPAAIRRRLWAFTLGYLAVEQGREFSGQAYLDSLLRQSAAHAGRTRQDAVARLHRALQAHEDAAPPTPALTRSFDELAQAPQTPPPGAAARSRELIRGYDLLDRVRNGLRGQSAAGGDLSAAVAELAEFHPLLWSQLHRELRSGGFSGPRLGDHLTPEALRRLIQGHLALLGAARRDGAMERLDAVERNAARAADRGRYYRCALRALVENAAVDFDALLRQMSATAEQGTALEGTAEAGDVGAGQSVPGRGGGQQATLVSLIDRLPRRGRDRVRRVLRGSGERAAIHLRRLLDAHVSRNGSLGEAWAREFLPALGLDVGETTPQESAAVGLAALLVALHRDGAALERLVGGLPEGMRGRIRLLLRNAGTHTAMQLRRLSQRDLGLGAGPASDVMVRFVAALEGGAASRHVLDGSGRDQPGQHIPRSDARPQPAAGETAGVPPPAQQGSPEARLLAALEERAPAGAGELASRWRDTQTLLEVVPARPEVPTAAAGEDKGVPPAARPASPETGRLAARDEGALAGAGGPESPGRDMDTLLEAVPARPELPTAAAGEDTGVPAPAHPSPPEARLLAALEERTPGDIGELASLSRDMQTLLEAAPARLEALLARLRQHGTALERLVAALPERLLTRLLWRLRDAEHHDIQTCADTLAGACGFADMGAEPERLRNAKWRFILGEWLGQGLLFEPRTFVRQLARHLGEQVGWPDERGFRFLLRQQLRMNLLHTERQQQGPPPTGHASSSTSAVATGGASAGGTAGNVAAKPDLTHASELPQAFQRRGLGPRFGPPLGPRPGRQSATKNLSRHREIVRDIAAALDDRSEEALPVRPADALRHPEPVAESGEDLFIDNAGLVLAAPYLPRLFAMLELLDGTVFRDAAAAERAVHLLQYLVDGGEGAPEYRLVLNKVLCGLPIAAPIEREAGLSDREKEAADGLLRGMIENWKGIGHTSVAGLRETFLRREGRMRLKDGTWQLLVAPKPFDMLLDTLPWSIAVIRHRWMDRVIHVAWR